MVTGESMPVDKRPGDRVISATLVVNRTLTLRAERSAATPTATSCAWWRAQRTAPIQRLADRVADARSARGAGRHHRYRLGHVGTGPRLALVQ
jgi:cation transport ATPase